MLINLKRVIAILIIAVFLLQSPSVALANTAATDNFDSYSNGAALNTLNGGSGWTGAWSGGAFTITNSVSQTSPNSTTDAAGGAETFAGRSFTGTATADYRIYVRLDGTSGDLDVGLTEGGTTNSNVRAYVRFSGGNIVQFYSSFSTQNVGTFSANTWYSVDFRVDCNTDTYQVSIDQGAYSTSQPVVNSTCTVLDGVIFHRDVQTDNAFIDSLQPTPSTNTEFPLPPQLPFFWWLL